MQIWYWFFGGKFLWERGMNLSRWRQILIANCVICIIASFYYQDQNADCGLYCQDNFSNCLFIPNREDKFEHESILTKHSCLGSKPLWKCPIGYLCYAFRGFVCLRGRLIWQWTCISTLYCFLLRGFRYTWRLLSLVSHPLHVFSTVTRGTTTFHTAKLKTP